mgnify:FL=1
MKALLLAAGYGKRLRPITNKIPKCLVPIKDKPLLGIWLKRLHLSGFGPFLINTHYKHNQVLDFIYNFNQDLKLDIKIVHEEKLLGTAGTLIANLDFIDEHDDDLILIHADNYCLANLNEFKIAHKNRPKKCLMSMMVFKTDTPKECGIVELDKNNILINLYEKVSDPPNNLANGAIYILSKQMLNKIKKNFLSSEDFVLDIILNNFGKIFCYETSDLFLDIGTKKNYKKANTHN